MRIDPRLPDAVEARAIAHGGRAQHYLPDTVDFRSPIRRAKIRNPKPGRLIGFGDR